MHKRTKALDIGKRVKDAVWRRDGECCILCGSPRAMPNAHYISRAQSGLGIEQNIVTLCLLCHNQYDHTTDRKHLKKEIAAYLQGCYPDWDERNLIYKKE